MNTLTTQCELCNKELDSKVFRPFKKFAALCPSCLVGEIKALTSLQQSESIVHESIEVNDPIISQQNITEHNIPFSVKDEFWNAENTQLDALSNLKPFEKYQVISQRLTHWQNILFEAQQSIAADYIRLQSLKVDLTNDERKALKITYSDYQPGELNPANVKPTVQKKPRESADDKAARTIAEAIYKRQIMKGESIQSKLAKEHPEYYLNGYIREEFRNLRDELFKNGDAMTLEQAIAESQKIIRSNKQSGFDSIEAKGKIQ